MKYEALLSIIFICLFLIPGFAADNSSENRADECPICLNPYNTDPQTLQVKDEQHLPPLITTPCGHTYHQFCLNKWLEDKNNCPECRQELKLPVNPYAKDDKELSEKQKIFITLAIVGGALGLEYYVLPLFTKPEQKTDKE